MGIFRDHATVSGQYFTEVNKGGVNMSTLQSQLNRMWSKGYRLHTALEQNGNTVMIYEMRDDAAGSQLREGD